MKNLLRFYLTPGIHSVATLLFLAIFSFFALYYLDNVFVALRYLVYVLMSHTALTGIVHLFVGMAFVVALAFPFALSIYSILVLPHVWEKKEWSGYVKAGMTALIIAGGVVLMAFADGASRAAARHPSMQSFVEDAGLSGRI